MYHNATACIAKGKYNTAVCDARVRIAVNFANRAHTSDTPFIIARARFKKMCDRAAIG